jgi:hypothetical protein
MPEEIGMNKSLTGDMEFMLHGSVLCGSIDPVGTCRQRGEHPRTFGLGLKTLPPVESLMTTSTMMKLKWAAVADLPEDSHTAVERNKASVQAISVELVSALLDQEIDKFSGGYSLKPVRWGEGGLQGRPPLV